ncbi:ABC transporter ATP-binding protein [Priestia koreensis]|uniref:ABC transporter ATP-binding protein n=1 Tax=Priestia koreensis TaxID=284581 RepID=UPI00203FF821|nr:dipeptide/oligopeptide/nickel ABC transporter ATP-binding protein [Priestia koreensis]MCM3005195.1 dipeptide/oligopeptide/nickel ABC transporter ATP-binding protein [Priestia koreensis]
MLLELQGVTKAYPIREETQWSLRKRPSFHAVEDINVTIQEGEIVGLVGESGCGKSTLAKLIMNIEDLSSGSIYVNGQSINQKKMKDIHLYKQIQLVLQDSSSSLYPNMSIREILEEPLRNYFPNDKSVWEMTIHGLLERVLLDHSFLLKYPYQLSGGQKQRICIAKALAVQPKMIVFDESLASLDPFTQQEMMVMLKQIQKEQNLSYLFITHDLKSVQSLCDRVIVMYKGKIVETITNWYPQSFTHPYTRLLFETLI